MVGQYLVTMWIIFSWLLLALQVKVGKVASFVVRAPTTKATNILPHENYQLYDIALTFPDREINFCGTTLPTCSQ